MSTAAFKEVVSGLSCHTFTTVGAFSSNSLGLGISARFSRQEILSPCDIRLGRDTEECHMRERTEFLNAYLILENVFCGCSGSDKCYMHLLLVVVLFCLIVFFLRCWITSHFWADTA